MQGHAHFSDNDSIELGCLVLEQNVNTIAKCLQCRKLGIVSRQLEIAAGKVLGQ